MCAKNLRGPICSLCKTGHKGLFLVHMSYFGCHFLAYKEFILSDSAEEFSKMGDEKNPDDDYFLTQLIVVTKVCCHSYYR